MENQNKIQHKNIQIQKYKTKYHKEKLGGKQQKMCRKCWKMCSFLKITEEDNTNQFSAHAAVWLQLITLPKRQPHPLANCSTTNPARMGAEQPCSALREANCCWCSRASAWAAWLPLGLLLLGPGATGAAAASPSPSPGPAAGTHARRSGVRGL